MSAASAVRGDDGDDGGAVAGPAPSDARLMDVFDMLVRRLDALEGAVSAVNRHLLYQATRPINVPDGRRSFHGGLLDPAFEFVVELPRRHDATQCTFVMAWSPWLTDKKGENFQPREVDKIVRAAAAGLPSVWRGRSTGVCAHLEARRDELRAHVAQRYPACDWAAVGALLGARVQSAGASELAAMGLRQEPERGTQCVAWLLLKSVLKARFPELLECYAYDQACNLRIMLQRGTTLEGAARVMDGVFRWLCGRAPTSCTVYQTPPELEGIEALWLSDAAGADAEAEAKTRAWAARDDAESRRLHGMLGGSATEQMWNEYAGMLSMERMRL